MTRVEENLIAVLKQISEKIDNIDEDDEKYKQLWHPFIIKIEEAISDLPHKPIDILPLFIVRRMIREFDPRLYPKRRSMLMETLQVKITPKDEKKGSPGVFFRLLRNYYKPHIRSNVEDFVLFHTLDVATPLKEAKKDEWPMVIEKMINELGFYTVWIIADKVIKNEDLVELVKETAPDDYIETIVDLFDFYREVDYETLFSPNYVVQSAQTRSLKKEHERLKKQVSKQEKETQKLKKEIHTAKMENKQLEGQYYELYEDSLKEIDALHKQLEEERLHYESIIQKLNKTIQELQINTENSQSSIIPDGEDRGDLEGKTIALIGGDRVRHFQEIVEKFNGNLEFVSEKDISLVEGAVSRSDVVFFFKEVAGHHLYRKAIQTASKKGIPFRYVNSKGISGFKRTLLSYTDSLERNASEV